MTVALRLACPACSADLEVEEPLGRSSRCTRCGADLRCCRACRFHDPSAYNDCAEPMADRVVDKERANFCEWFSPVASRVASPGAASADSLSELEKLFRKN